MEEFEPDRVRKWMRKTGARGVTVDGPVYDRMAASLFDALNAAGGPEHNFEKYFALVKVVSIIIGTVTFDETPEVARRWCLDLGEEVAKQVQSFRLATAKDVLARRPKHV